ncbi:MAG: hypothetical protein HOM58_04790 [Rhodospirillaceae bacterium]|jgi:hypothetical protein|nr:hypothetical protein [Rhodospirillaceae bacterium]MBT5459558.1 hypothetical protein [Rhodospirillaceae bacterium]
MVNQIPVSCLIPVSVRPWLFGLCFAPLCIGPTIASAADSSIETVDTPVISWISAQNRAGRDSLDNFETAPGRHAAFRQLLTALTKGDEDNALTLAGTSDFNLTALRHEKQRILAVTDRKNPHRGPTILINPNPKIDLIAGAPHPGNERGTYQQAVLLVTEQGARAAIIAGAHRCASRTYVTCDGRSRTCGSREAYRTSDVAHSPATLFHTAHLALTEAWPQAIVLSLHGMRTDDKGIRTSVVLSNGIRRADDAGSTASSRLRTALVTALPDEGAVASCNIPGDRQYKFRRLCGTTNVQGRLVNGDEDVCRRGVTSGTGRFIHLEQDRRVRNPFADDWRDVKNHSFMQNYLNAIASVAPPIK